MQNNQTRILAQNTEIKERKLKLRWLLAASCIPLFGIYAAFGIAPQTVTQEIAISTVVEELTLPESVHASLESTDYWQSDRVRRDDSFASLMKRLHISNDEAIKFLSSDSDAKQLAAQLKPGRNIQAQVSDKGELLQLNYQLNSGDMLTVSRTEGEYIAKIEPVNIQTRQILKSAEIKSSLFAATDKANIPDAIAIQVAEIFSSEIDFNNDLRKDDHFSVVYEADYNNGEFVGTGQVLAAQFSNQGKTYRAVMFRDEDGKAVYYTPEGKSLHKSFLRSPLEFSRISSGFSLGRFHPILNKMRAHKGVDYAAPTGTRVKAPGDGVVDFMGVKSGYGNVIVLKHDNGVSTVYGHLSRFESGLRRGAKVSQGESIAYVGMTGLATGPHLHYEFLLNGVHRDPVTVALPNAAPIAERNKAAFMAFSHNMTAQLTMLSNTNLAALE